MTNNRELFLKGIKNLFYIHCITLAGTIITALPFVGSWFGWVNTIIAIGMVFVLYQLAPVRDRYRKAAIFMAITVGVTIFARFVDIGILFLASSICSLIAVYQEYNGHSEMMAGVDEKLSRNWHSLFNWSFCGGIVVAILGSPLIVVLGALELLAGNVLASIVLALTGGFDVIISIFYLLFLKRTHAAYTNYDSSK